jgi:hypothetical protein
MAAKRVTLVVAEVRDHVGALAEALGPMAKAGVNLEGVVAYGVGGGAASVVCLPDCSDTAMGAAKEAGLKARKVEAVLLSGPDAPGVGARLAKRVAKAGINIKGLAAMVVKGQHRTLLWAGPKDAEALATELRAK